MNRKKIILDGFADAVPVACGMIGTVSAVLTAYQIEYSRTPMILFCVAAALLLSFWMNVPRYGFGFGALFFTFVIMLAALRMQEIVDGATAIAFRVIDTVPDEISGLFNVAALEDAYRKIADPKMCITLALMPISAVNGLLLSFSLIRSKTVLLPLLIPLPLMMLSLIYTNMLPAAWAMMLVCIYFGYTLLGNGLRKGDEPRRGRFGLLLAPLLAGFALLIAAAFPQKTYTPISEETRRNFYLNGFSPITDTVMSWFGVRSPREIDLNDAGNREPDKTELFSVYARSGVYHLRTHSYGLYDGHRWRAAPPYDGEWNSMKALGMRQSRPDAVMWIFGSMSNERIVPYAWTDDPADSEAEGVQRPVAEESYVHAGGWKDYGWRFTSRYETVPKAVTNAEAAYYTDYVLHQYVMPEGEERDALLAFAQSAGLLKTDDVLETARAVAAYVSGSGTYTLTPGDTPKGEDFVLYFLKEGHKGYCVHFASATTAILQAMGCPARYTTGYYVEVPEELSGEQVPVMAEAAHAWTEVYVPGAGWIPVESTPGRYTDSGTIGGTGTPVRTPHTEPTPVPTPERNTAEPTPTAPSNEPSDTPAVTPAIPVRTPRAPESSAAPHDSNGGQQGTGTGKKNGGAWWILIPLVPVLWVGTGLIIRRRREARFASANVKRSIPDMARYLKRLERFGIPKDPDAEEWAQEAVFSNHRMKEEHRILKKRVRAAQRTVYAKKPVLRFILKWVLYMI